MKIGKINWRKSTKLVVLLLSSVLIATASASIFNYMYLDADIGVEGMTLEWKLGVDNGTAGTQIAGVTASLTDLKGPPNGTRIYGDPLRLNNTGGSGQTFDLMIDSISGATVNMSTLYVRLYDVATNSSEGNLTVWSSGSQGSDLTGLSIASLEEWRFQWEITWGSAATVADSVTVNLKIRVPA